MSVGSTGSVTASQIMQIVQQSLEAENNKISAKRDEVTSWEDKQSAYSNIDSVMEQLESALYTLTKNATFTGRVASSSNTNLVNATATSGAAKSSFTFSSITQLAEAARVVSSGALGLVRGTAAYLLSSADVNGGTDYNPNIAIATSQQGCAITSGTFTINDTSITVAGTDSLYKILTKINNAGAGVTATFDAATDSIRISGTTVGADETITFNSGTTNFFAATNLTGTLTAGTDAEENTALDSVTAASFSGIQDGYFNINNYTFQVDVSEDSLADIINRINASNCGATIFYDPDSDKITITNENEGDPLILGNDTSNFLDSIQVLDRAGDQDADSNESIYTGKKAEFVLNGETITKDSNNFTIAGVTYTLIGVTNAENSSATVTVTKDTDATIEAMQSFVSQYNATISLLDSKVKEEDGPLEGDIIVRRLMSKLRTETLQNITNPGQFDSLGDIGFSFEKSDGKFVLNLDEDTLREQIDVDETSVRQLFAFNNDTDGLLDDGGYAVNTRATLKSYTRSVSGFFYTKIDKINDYIDRLQLDITGRENDLIDKEERLFDKYVHSIQALQDLSLQSQRISQINSIVMSSLMSSGGGY